MVVKWHYRKGELVCESTSAEYQKKQVPRLESIMDMMRLEGIPSTATPFRAVSGARAKLLANIGFRLPRIVFSLLKLYGLSPGTITLFFDAESGFFTDAREKPGAPPIYRVVSDEVAMVLLKGELTKELEVELMTPVDYYGE